jgi:hypothetical protein
MSLVKQSLFLLILTFQSYVPENEELSKEVLTETDQYTLFSASNITHISVISNLIY